MTDRKKLEARIIEEKSYSVPNGEYYPLMNSDVIHELLGDLYTKELDNPKWARIEEMYRGRNLLERYLVLKHFPALSKRICLEMPTLYNPERLWTRHTLYFSNYPTLDRAWKDIMSEDEKKLYKEKWLEHASLVGYSIFINLIAENPPEQRHIDDMRLRICYLDGTQHTFDELIYDAVITTIGGILGEYDIGRRYSYDDIEALGDDDGIM